MTSTMISVSPPVALSSSGSAFIRPIPRSPISSTYSGSGLASGSGIGSGSGVVSVAGVVPDVIVHAGSAPQQIRPRSPNSADTLSSVEYRSFGELAAGMVSGGNVATAVSATPSAVSNPALTPRVNTLAVPVQLRGGEGGTGSQLMGLGVEPSMGSVSGYRGVPNAINIPEPPLELSPRQPSFIDWPEDQSKVEGMTTDLTGLRRRLEEQRLHLDDLMMQKRQEAIGHNAQINAARSELERLQKECDSDRSRLQSMQRQQEKILDQIDEVRRKVVELRTDREHDAEILRDRSDDWQAKRRREMDDLRAAIETEQRRIQQRKTEYAVEANGMIHKLEASVEEVAADVEEMGRLCELESAETKELELRQDAFDVQLDKVRSLVKQLTTHNDEDVEHHSAVGNLLRDLKMSLGELELENSKLKEDLQHDSLKVFRDLRRVAAETEELQKLSAYDGMKLSRISKRTTVGLAELDGLRHEARRLYRAQKSEHLLLGEIHDLQAREREKLQTVDQHKAENAQDLEKATRMIKTREQKAYEVENGPINVSEKHVHHLHKHTDVVHVHRTPYTRVDPPKAPATARGVSRYPIRAPGVELPPSPSSSTRRRHSAGTVSGRTREPMGKRSSSPPLPPPRSHLEAARAQQLKNAFGPVPLPACFTESSLAESRADEGKKRRKNDTKHSSRSSVISHSSVGTAGSDTNSVLARLGKTNMPESHSSPWDEPLDLRGDGKSKYRSTTPPVRGVATPPPVAAPGAKTPPPRQDMGPFGTCSSWRETSDGGRAKPFVYKF